MYIFCFRYIITHNETTSYDITHNQQALQIGSFKKGKTSHIIILDITGTFGVIKLISQH